MTRETPARSRRRTAGKPCRRTRRAPLAEAVPQDVLAEVNHAIRMLDKPTPAAVAEIHDRFKLLDTYGVTLRQAMNHAKRRRRRPRAEKTEPHAPVSDTETTDRARRYRRRMDAIGAMLSAVFVGMDAPESDLWGRGAYLKLVAKVSEALDGDDLTIEDLHALSKIISEQRRAQSNALETARRLIAGAGPDGAAENANRQPRRELPAHFDEVVKQIYGVNLRQEPG